METRMRKLVSIKSTAILLLVLLVVLGSALAARHYRVSGWGKVAINFAAGTGTGDAELTIGGDEYVGTVYVLVPEPVKLRSGALYFEGVTHTFTFPTIGKFETLGNEMAVPVGEGVSTLTGYMDITGGDKFSSGRLSVKGELHANGTAYFEVNGAVGL